MEARSRMGQVKIVFPTALTNVTDGEKEIHVVASTLREALNMLVSRYGKKFEDKIYDPSGRIRRFLNFYMNGKNIAHLGGIDIKVQDGDEVSILPAVAGG